MTNGAPSGDPVVSVVIPTYNMGGFLTEAVESVLLSSLRKVEVIVVDDGSTDDTESLMRSFTEVGGGRHDPRTTYIWQENAGKPAAVNRGLSIARGTGITMLDADDQFTRNGLRILADALEGDPGAEMAIGGFVVFDRSGTYGTRPPPKAKSPTALRRSFYLRWRTPFALNACLLDRQLVERVGQLDVKLDRCIDGDYALRCLGQASGVATVDEVVYRYRKHRQKLAERVRVRVRTARNRPYVIWKNYNGLRRWVGVILGLILDSVKLVYELFAPYRS